MTDAKPTRDTRRDKSRPFDKALGERIRLLRSAAGVSQTNLAMCLGVSHQQVQNYETGRQRLTGYTIQQIASALSTSVPVLFGDGLLPTVSEPVFEESMKAAAAVQRIKDPNLRRRLLAFIEELTRADAGRAEQP